MVDPYMGAAHRSDRAREQARAFNEPTGGFVAPGVPVEVAPPPAPPSGPSVVGPAAGGSGAAGLWAIPGLVAGFGLGWWATKEVREWKRGHYRPSKVYRGYPEFDPLFSFNQEIDLSRRYADVLWGVGAEVPTPSDFYSPDGKHGPTFWQDGGWHWYTYHDVCPANPATEKYKEDTFMAAACTGVIGGNSWTTAPPGANCAQLVASTAGVTWENIVWRCTVDAPPHAFPDSLGGFSVPAPGRIKMREVWVHHADYTATQGFVVGPGTSRLAQPLFLEDYALGHGTTVEEGEPSYEQQVAPEKLARGRTAEGYVVPFSLAVPFTVVRYGPGAPSLTVPDQVIDPEAGTVTIQPPGHPPGDSNPNDEERRERKPLSQRLLHLGFVAINVVTETQDFLEAMHQGLPKKFRTKPRKRGGDVPPWQIAEDIWDHWDQWDADVALEAFVNNQIEDEIYGRYFGLRARLQRKAGFGGKPTYGLHGHGRFSVKLPVPEVHFAQGEHSVSLGEWDYDLISGRITEGE